MRKVIIESPYAGDVQRNEKYLKACVIDSLSRGEAPLASHGFYTQYLDDDIPEERKTGIHAGLAWALASEAIVYYLDLGFSSGMLYALQKHTQRNAIIEARLLSGKNYLEFDYKNWRGEQSRRKARFEKFYWGRTEWHPRDQILMEAMCLDRGEKRVFAVQDMALITSPLIAD